jgi:hypothetical protein
MRRKALTIKDGPLEGAVYELDLAVGEEVGLRLADGRVAVHRAELDKEYADSAGHTLHCLRFVSIASEE